MVTDLLIEVFLSVFYGIIILALMQKLLFNSVKKQPFIAFFIYVVLAVIYYWLNITIVPDYKGFTGGLRIGTDDCSFFAQIVDVRFSLPMTCNDLMEIHNYSKFVNFLYPFEVRSPLPIIVFNCIGISCIPLLGKTIYEKYFPNDKNSRLVYLLFFLSPTVLMNGLILIRDGWSTQFFMFFIYCVIEKKNFLKILLCMSVVAFLRPTFVIFPILFYIVEKNFNKPNFYLRMGLLSMAIIPISSYILKANKGVDLSEGLVRQDYVEGFLGQFGEESMLYRIMMLPFPLNVILSFLFFLTSPFLKWGFYNENILVIRKVFTFLEAAIMTILVPNFLLNFLSNWKKDLSFKRLAFFAIISLLLLSTISMQARHKMIVLPVLYMLFVFSLNKKNNLLVPIVIFYCIFQLLI